MWSATITRTAIASSLSLFLVACGGGSSGSSDKPESSQSALSNGSDSSAANAGTGSSNSTSTETGTSAETTAETSTNSTEQNSTTTPDNSATDVTTPEVITPGINAPEAGLPDVDLPDTSSPNNTTPDNGTTATDSSGNQNSVSAETDTGTTDASTNVDPNVAVDGEFIDIYKLQAVELALTSTELMSQVKASIATRDNQIVEQIHAGNSTNPSNVQRVESILSSADWDYIFPKRAVEYSYENFLKATGKFPAFCGDYNDGRDADAICRKSLATMFAHFTQETGGHTAHWDVEQWRQGLVHVREMGWNEDMRGGYNGECLASSWQGQTWPCGTFEDGEFKSYFGRGAKQLSYNYNYGPFSEAMFGDVRVLLDNPELVADTWLNLASAIFFFVYPQPPKPSMLHVIDGTWVPNSADLNNQLTPGFGVTTQIINGGVECGGSVEVQQSVNRMDYYENFTRQLGVSIESGEVLGCKGMKQFDEAGAGALNIYWEESWDFVAGNPGGKSYACKLVGYQTPFSVFKEGDYVKCVEHYFDVTASDSVDTTSVDNGAAEAASTDTGSTQPQSSATWSAGSIYNSGDQVQWDGLTYEAQWWTQGDTPSENTGSGKVWKLIPTT